MIAQRMLLALVLGLCSLLSLAQTATTFTYQGRLYNNGLLANGSYALRITPFGVASGGAQLAAPQTIASVTVVDGIFSTTLDFGASVFLGSPVWLAIEVQAPSSSFVLLAPRQPVTPTPYAINADKLDGLDAAQIGNHDFAEFFALMPGDNAATVAPGADVQFPQNGPATAGILRLSDSNFLLTEIGTYQVTFQVSVMEAGQLLLTLNGVDRANTVVGRAIGSSQITGTFLVETTQVNSILSLRNPAGNNNALTITPLAGGTRPVVANIVIVQLR